MIAAQYAIGSGGNAMPGMPRQYRDRPELVERCLAFFDAERPLRSSYDAAIDAAAYLEGMDIAMEEAHALPFIPMVRDHDQFWKNIGGFLGACYDRCGEEVIVYDLDIPINILGAHTGKILVNKGNVGHSFGYGAKGFTVNLGNAGAIAGCDTKGIFVDLGVSDYREFGGRKIRKAFSLSSPTGGRDELIIDQPAASAFGDLSDAAASIAEFLPTRDSRSRDLTNIPLSAEMQDYIEQIIDIARTPEALLRYSVGQVRQDIGRMLR